MSLWRLSQTTIVTKIYWRSFLDTYRTMRYDSTGFVFDFLIIRPQSPHLEYWKPPSCLNYFEASAYQSFSSPSGFRPGIVIQYRRIELFQGWSPDLDGTCMEPPNHVPCRSTRRRKAKSHHNQTWCVSLTLPCIFQQSMALSKEQPVERKDPDDSPLASRFHPVSWNF